MTHTHVLYIKHSRTISALYIMAQLSSRLFSGSLADSLLMSLTCVVEGPL